MSVTDRCGVVGRCLWRIGKRAPSTLNLIKLRKLMRVPLDAAQAFVIPFFHSHFFYSHFFSVYSVSNLLLCIRLPPMQFGGENFYFYFEIEMIWNRNNLQNNFSPYKTYMYDGRNLINKCTFLTEYEVVSLHMCVLACMHLHAQGCDLSRTYSNDRSRYCWFMTGHCFGRMVNYWKCCPSWRGCVDKFSKMAN